MASNNNSAWVNIKKSQNPNKSKILYIKKESPKKKWGNSRLVKQTNEVKYENVFPTLPKASTDITDKTIKSLADKYTSFANFETRHSKDSSFVNRKKVRVKPGVDLEHEAWMDRPPNSDESDFEEDYDYSEDFYFSGKSAY